MGRQRNIFVEQEASGMLNLEMIFRK